MEPDVKYLEPYPLELPVESETMFVGAPKRFMTREELAEEYGE